MSFTVPNHSKGKKGRSSVHAKNLPSNNLSREHPEREGQRMRDLSLGSPSAPPGVFLKSGSPHRTTNPLGITTNWIPEQQDLQMKDLPPMKHMKMKDCSLSGDIRTSSNEGVRRPQIKEGDGQYEPSFSGKGKGPDEQTSTLPVTYMAYEPTFGRCLEFVPTSGDGSWPTSYTITSKRGKPPYHEFCSKCRSEHHPLSYCPVLPCKTCFDPHHSSARCPFFSHIPKGAVFDRANYEIICDCHFTFNEEKWVCVRCDGTSPKLQPKYCKICSEYTQHLSHECPNDKVRAAQFQAFRDRELSRKKIPYVG